MDNLPAELETEPLPQQTRMLDADGNADRDALRPEPHQRPARARSRGRWSSRSSRSRTTASTSTARSTSRARCAPWSPTRPAAASVQGGSSITQQMVKHDAARPGEDRRASARPRPTTPTPRKLRELRYAIAFEQNYSKDWILERYLNIAYFGDGAYGVQSAARHYFDKNAKDLDLRESAMLAGLVKNPDRLRPDQQPRPGARAPQRRARPDGPAQRDHREQGRPGSRSRASALRRRAAPRTAACYSGAPFFCDYVAQLPADRTRRSARPSRSASSCSTPAA